MKLAFPGYRVATVEDLKPKASMISVDTETGNSASIQLDHQPIADGMVWFFEQPEAEYTGRVAINAFLNPDNRFLHLVPA